jgi:hypothetical protein
MIGSNLKEVNDYPDFCGFPQYLHTNIGTLPRLGHYLFQNTKNLPFDAVYSEILKG